MLVAVVLLAGCASMQTTEWKGQKIDEVIKEFGPPARTLTSADGKTMYEWTLRSPASAFWGEFANDWGANPPGPNNRNAPVTWRFVVNSDGIITSWNRRCPSCGTEPWISRTRPPFPPQY